MERFPEPPLSWSMKPNGAARCDAGSLASWRLTFSRQCANRGFYLFALSCVILLGVMVSGAGCRMRSAGKQTAGRDGAVGGEGHVQGQFANSSAIGTTA